MTNAEFDRWTDRLSEYLDGDLSPRERVELERHLETCDPCRDVLEDLRGLVANAARLEDSLPEADLWPGIAHRIAEPAPARRGWLASWFGGGARLSISLPQLAVAAAVLVVVSGGGVWFAMRSGVLPAQGPVANVTRPVAPGTSGTSESTPATTSPAATSGTTRGADAQLAGYNLTRYDATIGELQQALTDNRGDLDSTTVRIIEQNLALIDRAIADARRALAADPANSYLNGHLTQQLQRKVRLLQKATVLVAEHQG